MQSVLIVDDDPAILRLFEDALKPQFHVLTAADGAAGKALLLANDVAALVADQMMPNLTGTELLREALDIRPNAARILVTATDRVGNLRDAVNVAQVHHFLSKPVRITELVNVVKSAVQQATLETENRRLVAELSQKNALLQRALSRVQDHERELEKVVEERTRQLKEANAELEKLALRDGLTGLYNHRFFQEAMVQEVARAARHGHPLSLIFLDVDHFKNYNDTCGHPAGDELLRELGRLLTATQVVPEFRFRGRLSDIVTRYGGEEFCIILPMTDRAGARVRAERVRELIAQYPFPQREVQPAGVISVSVGVASFPLDAMDKAGLIKAADDAMLVAKREGRNRVVSAPERSTT